MPPSWMASLRKAAGRIGARRFTRQLCLETLEDRTLMSLSLVADINPGTGSSSPSQLVNVSGHLFFTANNGSNGVQLWETDGSSGGTHQVVINPSGSSNPTNLVNVNGVLYFAALDGSQPGAHGDELWRSDGTSAGTSLVKDINPGVVGSYPTNLQNVNGTLFFSASDGSDGTQLWRSDGTAAGTVMISDINPSGSATPSPVTAVGNEYYFSAFGGTNGTQLWKTNGTLAGTSLVENINPYGSSNPSNLTNVDGTLFFSANDGLHGYELWESSGTTNSTVMVGDINPGAVGSYPANLINMNGTLFFSATEGTQGAQLWEDGGIAVGLKEFKIINPNGSAQIGNMVQNNNTLYFTATDGTHGVELWKSNGTSSGTGMVDDIAAGAASSNVSDLTAVNGVLFFTANDGSDGVQIWETDGVAAGTNMVRDVPPLQGPSNPSNLAVVNQTLFFAGTMPNTGTELWRATNAVNPGTLTATGGGSSVFTLTPSQSLALYNNGTWQTIGNYVEAISSVTQANGQAVLFAELTNGSLFRFSTQSGWQQIGGTGSIMSLSAGTDLNGNADVFVLTTADQLTYWTTNGWAPAPIGGTGTIESIAAMNGGRVAAVATDHSIFEFDPHFGWLRFTGADFGQTISAAPTSSGSAVLYVVTLNGGLWQHIDATGWTQIGSATTIQTVSAGQDAYGDATAFLLLSTGQLAEYDSVTGWSVFAAPKRPFEISAAGSDAVFMVMADGSVYGHTDAFGFYVLTSPGFGHL